MCPDFGIWNTWKTKFFQMTIEIYFNWHIVHISEKQKKINASHIW